KASFAEDLIESLNLALFRQQQQIERLTEQVRQLKEQADRQPSGAGGGASADPRADLPPHY
ncbi:MAG: SlyX family protein, partial [Comamonas sp.]